MKKKHLMLSWVMLVWEGEKFPEFKTISLLLMVWCLNMAAQSLQKTNQYPYIILNIASILCGKNTFLMTSNGVRSDWGGGWVPLMIVTILWTDAFLKKKNCILARLKQFDLYFYSPHKTQKFLFNKARHKQQIEWSNLRKDKQ